MENNYERKGGDIMKKNTMITIDEELESKAKAAELNISEIISKAIEAELELME